MIAILLSLSVVVADVFAGVYEVARNDTIIEQVPISEEGMVANFQTIPGRHTITSANEVQLPYPPSDVGIEFDFDTHVRKAVGSDNWPITWGADGEQYTSWGDGNGFQGSVRTPLGVARVSGGHAGFVGDDLWQGSSDSFGGKSYGILDIDGVLYMWVTPGSGPTGYNYVRLAHSEDGGSTWEISDERFVTIDDGIGKPTFLQFGRAYLGARDQFVYSYFIGLEETRALTVQVPGNIYLVRVHDTLLLDFSAYEWWAADGWVHHVSDAEPVFSDQSGVGWNCSASYNTFLRKYILCTEHERSLRGKLGIFCADEPWGPWETIYYQGDGSWFGTTFFWNFSNKWARDDKFVLVFTGVDLFDSWNSLEGRFIVGEPVDPAWRVDVGLEAAGDWVSVDEMEITSDGWNVDTWCGADFKKSFYLVDGDGFVTHIRTNADQVLGRLWHAGYWADPYGSWAVFRMIPPKVVQIPLEIGQLEPCWSEPDGDDWMIVGTYCGADVAGDSCYVEVVDMGLQQWSLPPWCNPDTDWDAKTRVWSDGCIVIRLGRWHLPCVVRLSSLNSNDWATVRIVPQLER